MDDQDADQLHQLLARRGGFGHREHLELAWTYLGRHPLPRAEEAMAGAIRYVAGRHGAPDRYHETITRSWMRIVALHRRAGDAGSFDEFLARNPQLLNRRLLERHYSVAVLAGAAARAGYVEPDLRAWPDERQYLRAWPDEAQ